MRTLLRIAAVAILATGTACAASGGGDQVLVSPGQPHAIISTSMPPGPSHYEVKIVWIDGKYLSSQGKRNTLWIKPGEHEIGFRAVMNTNRGPAMMSTPATSAMGKMRTMKLDLKRGYRYYFAADVPHGNPAQWKPILLKTEKGGN